MSTLLLNISEAEIAVLNYERFNYPSSMIQKRIHAVYLKAALSWPNSTIHLLTGLYSNGISFWVNEYKKNGLAGLLSNNYGTNKSELENHSTSFLTCFNECHRSQRLCYCFGYC